MKKADPSAHDDSVHYPSFTQASAPPMSPAATAAAVPVAVAQPVYHYTQQQQQQQQQYQPPLQEAPSYVPPQQRPLTYAFDPSAYEPPVYSGDYRRESFCGMSLKLVLFHLLNAILGIAGFCVVTTGVSLSVGLLPLCCFGLVVFRVVLFIVRYLAQLDVQLYNYISPAEEHVYLSIPQRAGFLGLEGRRLAPSLSAVSPLSLMATLYFASVKFAFGILSLMVLMVTISFPLAEVAALVSDPEDMVEVMGIDVHEFNLSTDPLGFTVATICMFIIGVALMHIVARLSRTATRFFCCERFSTYRYVQTAQFPAAAYPAAASSYGTTTSV